MRRIHMNCLGHPMNELGMEKRYFKMGLITKTALSEAGRAIDSMVLGIMKGDCPNRDTQFR